MSDFSGATGFVVQWRMRTIAPTSELPGNPAVLNLAGGGSAIYAFTMTAGRVRLARDNPTQLIMYYDINSNAPHTYRVEVRNSNQYLWFVDGAIVHSGLSIGPYPESSSVLLWSSRYYLSDNTTQWDYIRYGVIPQDGSGDYDSNSTVDETDTYFFLDCLLTVDGSYPGCKWADMNADGTVSGADINQFANQLVNQK